ncbi:MAG: DUF3572 family protein [Pseudomonadota bacterium]
MSATTMAPNQFVLSAFAFLAEDDARLRGLLDLAGLTPDQAKIALIQDEPGFASHIATYLLSDESWARRYAERQGLSPDQLAKLAHDVGHEPLMT